MGAFESSGNMLMLAAEIREKWLDAYNVYLGDPWEKDDLECDKYEQKYIEAATA